MKLKHYLDGKHEFDTELVTEQQETEFSFCWNLGDKITPAGLQHFSKLMNSTAVIRNGNIVLLNDSITEDELREFTAAAAGYIGVTRYNLWFQPGV